jgi:c-di-GMP-binding flagellar brake protein YcgR
VWSFGNAPEDLQALFPQGRDPDWVVHVPEPDRSAIEPSLLQWQSVYPVASKELPDQSVVYWGAPREALQFVPQRELVASSPPEGAERRAAPRVSIDCSVRYETHAEPSRNGRGHTIDMSSTGVAFTTESLLPKDTEVTLHLTWPVRLKGDIAVQLSVHGKVIRAAQTKAALQLDAMSFEYA